MHTLHKVLTPFGLAFGLLVLALGALQGAMPQVVIGLAVLASVLALTLVGSRRYRRSPYGRAYRALTILVVVAMLGGMLPPPLSAQAPTASRTDDQVHVAGQPASPPGKLERPAAQPNRLATSPPPQRSNQPPSTFWADLDGDHDVDEGDLKRIAQFWNCADTDPCYDATYDFNSDGIIDALDMAYVGNEYDVTPPELTVTSPADGAVVGGAEINVTGVISDKHTVNVTVNGVAATLTDQDFTASVPVSSGNQALHVVATDEVGQATSSSRVVGVDNDGPMIQVHAPKNRQSVYILRPTIDLSYADFYTAVDPATLQVLLTDAGGTATDVSTYLAAGADGASGQVGFDLTQDTAYTLTASVADTVGNLGTYRTTFYVPADPATITPPDEPEDAGWVSGRVYDSSTCEGASENQPVRCDGLAGAEVRLSYAGNPTDTITGMLVTGPDGFFAFPVAETDRYWLRVEKAGYTYGQREAEVVKERSTPVNEIYLTPLDPNHQLCDSSGCDLTSSDGMLRVQIPAGAITGTDEVDLSATFFNQVEFLPSGGLPEGTWETYGFNLGGDSVYEFTKPITVWVNNTLGFSPNTPIPLGFWNQETQEWEHAGTSWVDDSGEWVVFTTTHFSTFDCNDPVTLPPDDVVPKLDEESEEDEPCGEKDTSGSAIILRSGILREEYELPPVLVLGEPLGSTFRYDSGRADPTEIIEVKIGLEPSPGIELGDYVQCELFIEGEKTDNFTFAASGLTEGGEVGHFRYLWDGRDAQGNRLPPGVYHYSIHVRIPYRAQYYFSLNGQFGAPPDYANGATGVYVNATAEDWLHGTVTLNTDPSGPFGMGWTLQGLQRLYEDEAGRILIDSGCCVDEYYFPGKNLLLEDAQGGGSASQNMPTPADEVESQTGEGEPEATPESETATQPPANAPAPPVEVESQPVERELEETPENPLESQTAIPPLANALAPPVESQVVRGEPEVTPESKTTAGVGLSAEVENPPENETTTDMSVLSGQNTPPGITVEDEAVVSADNQPAEKPDVVGSELQSPILRLGSVQVSNIQSPISNLQYPISLPPAAYEFTALSTNVSGTIITHTTWTTAGSPYILTGDVVITRSVTLTIEQGVVVKGQSAAGLTVLGHLYAVGTVTQPITFTSATDTGPYQWEGLLFDGGSGHLRHVTVRYAGQSDGIATSNVTVRNVLTGEVRIESSQVVSTNHSYVDYGLYVEDSHVVVSDTLFSDNNYHTYDYALYATGASTVITVANCTFQDNAGYAGHVDADSLYQTWLVGNTFSGNGKDRVMVDGGTLEAGASLTPQTGLEGYELDDDLTVPAGITLTVEPGVTVMGQTNTGLKVQGHLEAVGSQPITFTSSTDSGPYQWEGLLFDGGSGHLRHVTVRYAGQSDGIATSNVTVRNVLTGEVRIESSQVVSTNHSYVDYGLYVENSHVVVSDTLFSDNNYNTYDYALYATGASTVITVTGCTFQDNLGYAVRVPLGGIPWVTGNTFSGNGKDRVMVYGTSVDADMTFSAQTGLEGYELDEDVTVPTGITLTVEPGVTVMGQANVELRVQGHLAAVGSQPITFTSSADTGPSEWSGLVFDGGTGELRHVTVRYGGDGNSVLGSYKGSNITVRDVLTGQVCIESSQVISESNYYYADYGLYVENSQVVVSDTLFIGNGNGTSDYALYATGDSTVITVTGCTFQDNLGYALYATGDSTVITVTGCTFQDNAGYAVRVPLGGIPWVTGNTFSGNGYDRVVVYGTSVDTDMAFSVQTGLEGYELDDDVTVPAGITLTVEPGVTVMGQGYTELKVQGHLQAVGTPGQPITFTSATDTGWNQWAGLIFDGGTGELRHVTVRYAGQDNSVHYADANILLHDVLTGQVTIESSQVITGYDYGLYVDNGHVVVSDTLFAGNGVNTSYHALYTKGASTAITVTNSTFQNNAGYPMSVQAGDLPGVLQGNTFSGNGVNWLQIRENFSDKPTIPTDLTLPTGTGLDGYEFSGQVWVDEGVTLNVLPGTALRAKGYASGLATHGRLYALGTLTQPITYAGNQGYGIIIDGSQAEAILHHLVVSDTYATSGGIVVQNGAIADLQSVFVSDSWSSSLYVNSGTVTVEASHFSNNSGSGISADNGHLTLTNTVVISGNRGGIHVTNGTLLQGDGLQIINNGTYDWDNGGLYVHNDGTGTLVTVTNSIFEGNTGYPLYVPAASLPNTLWGNLFTNNGNDHVYAHGDAALSADTNLGSYGDLTGYEFNGNLTVPAGVTLTVEPGMSLYWWGTSQGLIVSGSLYAVGTTAQPITFTSYTDTGQWVGLLFDGGTGELRHVTVRYGGNDDGYERSNITVRDVLTGEVRIESSRVVSTYRYAHADYGLYVENSHVVVSDTLFANNGYNTYDYALYATGASTVITVANCTFQDNAGYAGHVDADSLHQTWIAGNTFSGNGIERMVIGSGATAGDVSLIPQSGLEGYELEDDVTVPAGATLTVEPGVAVMGQYYAELQIQGHLAAVGEPGNPITFTSAADTGPNEWVGLVFDGGTGELRHVTVRYGGGGNNSVLPHVKRGSNIAVRDVLTGQVRLESGRVLDEHADYRTQPDYGLYVENSHVVVSDTLFSGNGNDIFDYALYATGASTVTVTGSIFQDNPGYPLRMPAAALSTMRDNIFIENGYDRIRLYGDETLPAGTELAPWPGLAGYEFEGDLTVPEGITLTVEPGLALYWASNKGLTVHGSLYAVGTVEQLITFTSRTDTGSGQWSGITFGDGEGELEHAIVRYAATGLAVNDGQVALRQAAVVNNSQDGIHLTGADTLFSATNCDISGNGASYYGLLNEAGVLVDARYNWWGHPSGPYHPTLNDDGQGDQVSDDVLFEPWLEEEVEHLGINNRTATDNTILTYNPANGTYTRYYPDGREVHFNADGTHAYTLDPAGNETAYTYDGDGSLAALEITPAGESTPRWTWTFAYTGGHLSSITDPAGRVATFEVDEHGDLVEVTYPDGSALSYTYDDEHHMTHQQDERGYVTTYVYDEHGRVRRLELPPRRVYDPATGQVTTTQEVHTYTPSDVAYQLVNDMEPGDPIAPTDALITSTLLVARVAYGGHQESYHTDAWGFATDRTDGLGRTTTYARDEAGRPTRVTSPEGNCTEYEHDEWGNLIRRREMPADQCALPPEERDPSQVQVWTYTYDPRFHNRMTSETIPMGDTASYEYDDAGNVIAVVRPPTTVGALGLGKLGQVVTPTTNYEYDDRGNRVRRTDPLGTVTCYTYTQGTADEAAGGSNPLFAPGVDPVPGLLTQEAHDCDGTPRTVVYREFDGAGNPQIIEEPGISRILQRRYDAFGRVISETNALGITSLWEYDAAGNLARQVEDYTPDGTTGRNVVTEYTYDAQGYRLSERITADDLTVQHTWGYDADHNLVWGQDPLGNVTRYVYDEAGQLVHTIDPAGNTITRTYTLEGRLETVTDAEGHVTRHVYDGLGRRVRTIKDEGGQALTTVYTYGLDSRLEAMQDPAGAVVRYQYDALGRRTAEVRIVEGQIVTRTWSYDENGRLVSETDERGILTLHEYDALGREVRTIVDEGGLAVTTVYTSDLFNNLVAVQDLRGTVIAYEYDALNRRVRQVEDPDGLALETRYTYDSLGNQHTVTDPNGVVDLTEYNAFGQPVRRVGDYGGLGDETHYTYDDALNLVTVTDANGNRTHYQYDELGRRIQTLYADGATVQEGYYPNDKLAWRVDQAGDRVDFTYDGAGRLVSKTYPDGSSQTFTYDGVGRQTGARQTMSGHTTEVRLAYNELGDVISSTQTVDGLSWTVTYAHDYPAGVVTVTYPSGAQVVRALDTLGRLSWVRRDGALMADYAYDDSAGTTVLTHANGVTEVTETDAVRRIMRVSSAVADYRYDYEPVGNRTFMQRWHESGHPADVYLYDGLSQLTQTWYGADATDPGAITSYEGLQGYALDRVGNRLEVQADGDSQAYLPNDGQKLTDPMNRYQQVDARPFNYDAKGNLLNDGVNAYTYDYENRLIEVIGPGGTAEYVYNALGQRVAKIADGVATYYIYDRDHQVIEEWDGGGQLLARYTYGRGTDRPSTMERGAVTYTYHRDALGSITEVTDETGALVERYTYDVYGAPRFFDGTGSPLGASAIGNPYLFTGRRLDVESGLYYYRARHYDPEIGRFLQQDPLGYTDGMNLYTYVGNNPVNSLDPMGETVYWAARDMNTNWSLGLGNHHLIIVVPDNPQDLPADVRQYITDLGGGVQGFALGLTADGDLHISIEFNNEADLYAALEYNDPDEYTSWWHWDFDLQMHEVEHPEMNDSAFIENIVHLANNFNQNVQENPQDYDIMFHNCATLVNSLFSYAGITEKERIKAGEFDGIDWAEENFVWLWLFDDPEEEESFESFACRQVAWLNWVMNPYYEVE